MTPKPKTPITKKQFEFEIRAHLPVNSVDVFTFKNNVFEEPIDFFSGNRMVFEECEFAEDVTISFATKELIFKKCTFVKGLHLVNCKFEENVKFWESTFSTVDFTNTTFKGLADFWACTFTEKVIFYKTDFLGTAVFSAATFQESVLFTYTAIAKVLIFRGTQFQNGLDLSQAIISGNVSLHDIRIKPFTAVPDVEDTFLYESYISEVGLITYKNKRETFRLLKQYYSKNGNEIDSLEYRKQEHYTLFQEVMDNLRRRKNIGTNLQNMVLLFFNCISNYFGVSYVLSLLFLIVFGGIFYVLSICALPEYAFTLHYTEWDLQLGKYFFEFLNPTHKTEYIQKENLTAGFYAFDFLGRIFVGYGIYQFIQAFRKYK